MFLDRYPGSAVDGGISSDEIIDVVVAPIIYRVIFQPWTLDDHTADTVVARLFD